MASPFSGPGGLVFTRSKIEIYDERPGALTDEDADRRSMSTAMTVITTTSRIRMMPRRIRTFGKRIEARGTDQDFTGWRAFG